MNIQKVRDIYTKDALVDNNILNDFVELDRIDIINKVFKTTYIPLSIIQNETLICTKDGMNGFCYAPLVIDTEHGYEILYQLMSSKSGLSQYDIELIAIAKEHGLLCVSNEKGIMNTCDELKVESTGTLGILGCAYENSVISRVILKELVDKLFSPACSCYLKPRLKGEMYRSYNLE